jgi:phosphinothricin acetyltransferase
MASMAIDGQDAKAPAGTTIRPAVLDDLARLTEIYNHYIVHTPITFDMDTYTPDERRPWFEQFATSGRHRLLAAERDGLVAGYAGSHEFRPRKAYDTTVEVTIYCAPEAVGCGIGSALYTALFEALAGEDIRIAVAGMTWPNEASLALHKKFGFQQIGLMHEVGRKFDRYWDVAWLEKRLSR